MRSRKGVKWENLDPERTCGWLERLWMIWRFLSSTRRAAERQREGWGAQCPDYQTRAGRQAQQRRPTRHHHQVPWYSNRYTKVKVLVQVDLVSFLRPDHHQVPWYCNRYTYRSKSTWTELQWTAFRWLQAQQSNPRHHHHQVPHQHHHQYLKQWLSPLTLKGVTLYAMWEVASIFACGT